MIDLNEEDVATMIQYHDDLIGASSVSISDFKATRMNNKAVIHTRAGTNPRGINYTVETMVLGYKVRKRRNGNRIYR
eukprot:scaffold437_cov288-Chaetoceros_neogracile.AAC.23